MAEFTRVELGVNVVTALELMSYYKALLLT